MYGWRRAAALALCVAAWAPVQAQSHAPTVDRERLETTEDLSESLANDLLDLSVAVRDRDLTRMARFFAPGLMAAPMPTTPGVATPEVKWLSRRTWSVADGTTARPVERDAVLAEWERMLAHFASIEDARFKVRATAFHDASRAVRGTSTPTAVPGAGGTVAVAFWLVGRNGDGQREWLRGSFEAGVTYPDGGPWRITSVAAPVIGSMTVSTDLFSEVSTPAGVARRIPAYGSPGNTGFTWPGAAAADIDGDGTIDLFVTTPRGNLLYLNDGTGRFRDVSAASGVSAAASGSAPLLLDVDNDGDLDAFISAVGPQVLLENRLVPDGRLAFQDVSLEARVAVNAVGFSAAAADINDDRRPDIYVASYNAYGRVTPNSWSAATNGTTNLLFVSQPDGTYREEAARWGVDDGRWSYAAAFADLTGDGRQDLYVANDFGENALFVRNGDRFVDEARARGVVDPGNGMGVSFGDYNNDGHLDLHVTNMSSSAGTRILGRLVTGADRTDNVLVKLASGNNLYVNDGGGNFRDVTRAVGGLSGGWAWGGGFIDVDNDGREDLYTPNGFISGRSMKDT
jgi:hypothetical protein